MAVEGHTTLVAAITFKIETAKVGAHENLACLSDPCGSSLHVCRLCARQRSPSGQQAGFGMTASTRPVAGKERLIEACSVHVQEFSVKVTWELTGYKKH